uniref:CsbD family protein n=1 Tax=Cyanothece sp. (strain PCC 7425 / ATCC 29141) TaxID=395961 RepID=B8HNP5_CYAP4
MSLEERAKATGKNIEGKVQEGMANLTGDQEDKVEGQSKQVEAEARHTKEDIKDKAKDALK